MEPGTDNTPAPDAEPVETAAPEAPVPDASAVPVETTPESVSVPSAAMTYVKTNAKTIAVVALVIVISSAYFHQVQTNDNLKKQTQKSNSAATASIQAKQLVATVGELVELPSNETPTVATVSDVSKLQNQAFFANAKNGDKVLLFAKSKQAILYRPSDHKVVQIAPLNPGSSAASSGNTTLNSGDSGTSSSSQ